MACSNNTCSGCNGFGVLGSVAGPIGNCGCGCGSANNAYYRNFPFYTGPCGPCIYRDTCAGRKCIHPYDPYSGEYGHGRWGCGCATVSECASPLSCTSAHFTAALPMLVAAGGAVPLAPAEMNPACFLCTEEGIRIRRPGSYMAIYTASIPAMQHISTRLSLSLNGETLENSAQDVSSLADASTASATAHLVFHALPNSLLQLVSSEDISLSAGADPANAFSLTLVKL